MSNFHMNFHVVFSGKFGFTLNTLEFFEIVYGSLMSFKITNGFKLLFALVTLSVVLVSSEDLYWIVCG